MRELTPMPAALAAVRAPGPAPVEYGAAVDRYLAQAALGEGSRRVYRISLLSWSWPLVGERAPAGRARRAAVPPLVPFARLGDGDATRTLAAALADRAARTGAATVNREVSALRSAAGWWRELGWLASDPTAGLRHLASPGPILPALRPGQLTRLLRGAPSLRDHALWRVICDSGASAPDVLALDVGDLDLPRHRARLGPSPGARAGAGAPPLAGNWIHWREDTSDLLRWLVAGRPAGPVFLTGRRARPDAPRADLCPVTGRARLSYRRAAEIFTAATTPLDPAARGWTLHQLQQAGGGLPGTARRPAGAGADQGAAAQRV